MIPTLFVMYEQSVRSRERATGDKKSFPNRGNYEKLEKHNSRELGLLGEEAVSYFYNEPLCNTPDYDLIVAGERVEVKSKAINVLGLKSWFEVNVFNGRKYDKKCDYYMFTIIRNMLVVKLVGYISKGDFDRISINGNANGVPNKGVKLYQLKEC
jgi:hypothetical protein